MTPLVTVYFEQSLCVETYIKNPPPASPAVQLSGCFTTLQEVLKRVITIALYLEEIPLHVISQISFAFYLEKLILMA